MSDHLEALRLFIRVARLGSFSAAGRELGVPQSTVSRTIAALEREIGASLLVRTTREVTVTDAGSDFLARIEPILADLEEAEHSARHSDELRGTLRIGIGTSLAARIVIPHLKPFLDRHPALQVDLLLDDEKQDLVKEGVDVAFRFGALVDSTATARKLVTWPRALAAAPSYLKTAPALNVPADLAAHAIIVGPQGVGDWTFRKGGTAASVRLEGRLRITVLQGAYLAAVEGMGIVLTTLPAFRREFGSGALVQVLPEWDLGSVDVHAVFTSGRAAKPSARAIVDYFADILPRA
ncbi:LysR family transcriptional regulator [Lichenihabitans psoromatis]|uniref:LysR family transcriptional regulator n=1 Tax=Lichenihabitans psoromatis TaxID=2528642 RepID=UPI0010382FAA|nr:LysR family transcriptional regulator [Lichenihabitans psoromatis]